MKKAFQGCYGNSRDVQIERKADILDDIISFTKEGLRKGKSPILLEQRKGKMAPGLNERLKQWLQQLAKEWGLTVEQVALGIAAEEISNRESAYPKIRIALSTDPVDLPRFVEAARESWALGYRIDAIRFEQFVQREAETIESLTVLVKDFPTDDARAINRINRFVDQAVELGYTKSKGGKDRAGAALLASVILTALHPYRYVDFRQTRWQRFAEAFGIKLPVPGASYGELLIWAGDCGRTFANTPTFQHYWPGRESFWVVSGICWVGPSPKKPEGAPIDIDLSSFPEGATQRRLHLLRERNQAVVEQAKTLRSERDPMLRCEICGFSFVEVYGELGRTFIEAHHKQPVAELKPGSRTRVEDIVLVCPNCHRMLHRGEHTLAMDELRGVMQKVRNGR
jgi:putative restriction endonuclease